MTLALVKRQTIVSEIRQDKSVNKWKIFRDVSEAKVMLDLKDRSLAVLDALLVDREHVICMLGGHRSDP